MMKFLLRDNEPSGAVLVDPHPEPRKDFSTISIIAPQWAGTIILLASIENEPEKWFEIYRNTVDEESNSNTIFNAEGCFIWMKVEIEDASGRIDRITVR